MLSLLLLVMQQLTIGILDPEPGWLIALKQIGVAFESVRKLESLDPQRYSVVVANKPLSAEGRAMLQSYAEHGGAVLDATSTATPDPVAVGNGWIAGIGEDVDSALTSTRASRTFFPAPSGRCPNEIVSRTPKHRIRKAIARMLQKLHAARGLPFVHLWYFPNDLPTVFCYRIDSDYGSYSQCHNLYRVAHEHAIRMTWFLHVGAHEEWLRELHRFEGQEFAVHGYRHRTFRTYEENYANIAEARAVLDAAEIPYCGFAAPYGFWNIPLARAVEDHGFRYASEFALNYDDLPFYPTIHREFSSVLQVPVHPVCIGSLRKVKESPQGMKEYFRTMTDIKIADEDPVIMYHHPTHEHWDVMDDTFAYARSLGLTNMTVADYAAWWKLRTDIRFIAELHGNKVQVHHGSSNDSVRLRVVLPDGKRSCISCCGETMLESVRWQPPPDPEALQERIVLRRRPIRLLSNIIEDFNARIRS